MSARNTLLVAGANLLNRVTGLVREVVFTALFGAGMVSDSFNAAFRIGQLLRELLVEGTLHNAFVPAFSEAQERGGNKGAWDLANAFLGVLLVVLGGVTLVFLLGAELWVRVIANEFAADPEKFALTAALTRWLSPFLAGLSVAGFMGAILNVRGRFVLPALSQSVLNLLVLAACIFHAPFERITGLNPIFGVALATTVSGFLQVGMVTPVLWREGFRFRPHLRGHPSLRKMIGVIGPSMLAISAVQINVLIESQWAASFGDGPLTWLYLSFRLIQIPFTVVAGSVAVTALAALSLAEARGDRAGFAKGFGDAIRLNSFLVLPTVVVCIFLPEELTRLLFERGNFEPSDTLATASMLRMYALGIGGLCFYRLAVPVFFAIQNTRFPTALTLIAVAAKIPVILVLTRVFGLGVEALPLSHAITATGEALGLLWGLWDRLPERRPLLTAHLRMLAAAAVMSAVVLVSAPYLHVVAVCALGGVAYLGASVALGLPEVKQLLLRGKGGLPPTVDGVTQGALRMLAADPERRLSGRIWTAAHTAEDGSQARHAWEMVAKDGRFSLVVVEPVADGVVVSGTLRAILKPAAPPTLRGMEIAGPGGERVWHALPGEVGEIVEGPCPGPRVGVG